MTSQPVRKDGEPTLAYMLRLAEWDKIHLAECRARFRDIDSANKRASVSLRPVATKQAEANRRSFHDISDNNPFLRRILRRMQDSGETT
jgi:hypothetical protein